MGQTIQLKRTINPDKITGEQLKAGEPLVDLENQVVYIGNPTISDDTDKFALTNKTDLDNLEDELVGTDEDDASKDTIKGAKAYTDMKLGDINSIATVAQVTYTDGSAPHVKFNNALCQVGSYLSVDSGSGSISIEPGDNIAFTIEEADGEIGTHTSIKIKSTATIPGTIDNAKNVTEKINNVKLSDIFETDKKTVINATKATNVNITGTADSVRPLIIPSSQGDTYSSLSQVTNIKINPSATTTSKGTPDKPALLFINGGGIGSTDSNVNEFWRFQNMGRDGTYHYDILPSHPGVQNIGSNDQQLNTVYAKNIIIPEKGSISGIMGGSDPWRIYPTNEGEDKGILAIDIGDNDAKGQYFQIRACGGNFANPEPIVNICLKQSNGDPDTNESMITIAGSLKVLGGINAKIDGVAGSVAHPLNITAGSTNVSFDGSKEQSINITPSSIGAAPTNNPQFEGTVSVQGLIASEIKVTQGIESSTLTTTSTINGATIGSTTFNGVNISNGSITVDTNKSITAGSFNATSDARLKENFRPLKTDKSILDLPTYKFDFINGHKNQIGCKAQDLQEICPEIVSEGSDGYLTIQESKLVYLLLEEVKRLRKEVDLLKGV